jgi:hypothetical protein
MVNHDLNNVSPHQLLFITFDIFRSLFASISFFSLPENNKPKPLDELRKVDVHIRSRVSQSEWAKWSFMQGVNPSGPKKGQKGIQVGWRE